MRVTVSCQEFQRVGPTFMSRGTNIRQMNWHLPSWTRAQINCFDGMLYPAEELLPNYSMEFLQPDESSAHLIRALCPQLSIIPRPRITPRLCINPRLCIYPRLRPRMKPRISNLEIDITSNQDAAFVDIMKTFAANIKKLTFNVVSNESLDQLVGYLTTSPNMNSLHVDGRLARLTANHDIDLPPNVRFLFIAPFAHDSTRITMRARNLETLVVDCRRPLEADLRFDSVEKIHLRGLVAGITFTPTITAFENVLRCDSLHLDNTQELVLDYLRPLIQKTHQNLELKLFNTGWKEHKLIFRTLAIEHLESVTLDFPPIEPNEMRWVIGKIYNRISNLRRLYFRNYARENDRFTDLTNDYPFLRPMHISKRDTDLYYLTATDIQAIQFEVLEEIAQARLEY
ncbi:hypothetical protein TRVA0_076S00408 [Trichomonascus vanleenenianus]|uniref:uncharacterized protein n=1 Tax=Trichomonascus vanleenenianus TaxID=2268995 RepID=UPI003EC9F99B